MRPEQNFDKTQNLQSISKHTSLGIECNFCVLSSFTPYKKFRSDFLLAVGVLVETILLKTEKAIKTRCVLVKTILVKTEKAFNLKTILVKTV